MMPKVILYVDGASRGNPGAAGIGIVISDETGKTLKQISEHIGEATNNVAEYTALIRGLEEAFALGADAVDINSDSELLVRQITGFYRVKAPHLQELHQRVIGLLSSFRSISIDHTPREGNALADKLAKQASRRKPVIIKE
jgi:ribonuclease HI